MENEELIQQVTEKAKKWLTPAYDAETQAEVKRMLENEDKTDLIEAFYKDLEFGTGGLRGIMGVGSNRMNIYTVGAATQGLSNYLNKNFKDLEQIAVVVGHDCRNTKIGSLGSVHTYHTGIKRILTWESTFTHQCIADRSLDPVSQFADFLVSTGDHTAAAYKNKRFLSLSDHFQRLVHIFFADVFDLTVNDSRMAWLVFIFHSCDILRNIHKNRARSSAFCNIKCSS